MNASQAMTWLAGGLLVCGGLVVKPQAARGADHVLQVSGAANNALSCAPDPGSGNAYYAEGWGYTASNVKICEVTVRITDDPLIYSGAICPTANIFDPATKHAAVVTIRNASTLKWVSNKAGPSSTVTWANLAEVDYAIPAKGPGCGAMDLFAHSVGTDL